STPSFYALSLHDALPIFPAFFREFESSLKGHWLVHESLPDQLVDEPIQSIRRQRPVFEPAWSWPLVPDLQEDVVKQFFIGGSRDKGFVPPKANVAGTAAALRFLAEVRE